MSAPLPPAHQAAGAVVCAPSRCASGAVALRRAPLRGRSCSAATDAAPAARRCCFRGCRARRASLAGDGLGGRGAGWGEGLGGARGWVGRGAGWGEGLGSRFPLARALAVESLSTSGRQASERTRSDGGRGGPFTSSRWWPRTRHSWSGMDGRFALWWTAVSAALWVSPRPG
ncbi:hypothetical protein GCE86_06845 [Micromonospora terminaliae]|uniref:Uncharacterized protein n=1 Tax=Micromonospora terminaliae TaxID=1914461 RepID=A0ABX6E2J8_9ACTN|nr:hypothetical protein GCE86_06845 [Micromonospora terminaliae]